MIDINTGVMIVWSGAAMEAQSSGHAEIEPYHFLCYALKFAEIDLESIQQMAKGTEEEQELRATQERLVLTFVQQWSIAVPEMSTQLRRALRQKGQVNHPSDKMLHRSKALRKAFEDASNAVASEGRDWVDVTDLINVILNRKEDWISSVMKKLRIPLHPENNVVSGENLQKYEEILFPLKRTTYLDDDDKKRIESDPIVKTLLAYVSGQGIHSKRPCLLIKAGTRFGEDILEDVVKMSCATGSSELRVGSVHSTAFLEKMTAHHDLDKGNLLVELIECNPQYTTFFFDAVHRYLSIPIVGEQFPTVFKQWLNNGDGRFVFETTEDHYRTHFEKQQEWKGVFHIIWVHELPKIDEIRL